MQKTSVKGKKVNTFSEQKGPQPRNFWRYSCHTVRDAIAEELRKTFSLSRKNWGDFIPKK